MKNVWVLSLREIKRFVRQKGRISGALLTPLLIWIILGQGIGQSFQLQGQSVTGYLEYFYPGVLLMVLLFTSIFSMITVIDDRSSGFLQSLWVSPLSHSSIIMGKVVGCSLIAVLQAAVFLFLASFAQIELTLYSASALILFLFVVALEISLLSFAVAWACHSTQSFHVWMNILLLPLWLFSGAVFDGAQVPKWMYFLMQVNPLSYALSGTRQLIYAQYADHIGQVLLRKGAIALVFGLIFYAIAHFMLAKDRP